MRAQWATGKGAHSFKSGNDSDRQFLRWLQGRGSTITEVSCNKLMDMRRAKFLAGHIPVGCAQVICAIFLDRHDKSISHRRREGWSQALEHPAPAEWLPFRILFRMCRLLGRLQPWRSAPSKQITKLLPVASDSGDRRAARFGCGVFSDKADMFLFCSRNYRRPLGKMDSAAKIRKIIHIDMDAFYASVPVQTFCAVARRYVVVAQESDPRRQLRETAARLQFMISQSRPKHSVGPIHRIRLQLCRRSKLF